MLLYVLFSAAVPSPEGAITVGPGRAAPPEDRPSLAPDASADTVEQALATWEHTPPGGGKPWFPRDVRCDSPAATTATTWACEVRFITPDGLTEQLPVIVGVNPNGSWDANLAKPA